MIYNAKCRLAGTMLLVACATWARAEGGNALRAYPDAMPEDTSFDSVVKSQPFPLMKYVVNAIGAKVHPKGQLIALTRSDDI